MTSCMALKMPCDCNLYVLEKNLLERLSFVLIGMSLHSGFPLPEFLRDDGDIPMITKLNLSNKFFSNNGVSIKRHLQSYKTH